MDLEKTVLERIVPSPEVVSSIQERADRLKRIVDPRGRSFPTLTWTCS